MNKPTQEHQSQQNDHSAPLKAPVQRQAQPQLKSPASAAFSSNLKDRHDLPSILSKDLVFFSRLSSALWSNLEQARLAALDTLSAASLQDLTSERILDRAVVALLQRANRGGSGANARDNMKVLFQAFYRLSPEERLVLVALHLGRWSYDRLTKILGVTSERLQEIAWKARVQMTATSSSGPISKRDYPSAPPTMGPHCPDYNSMRPWTQRMLDDEVLAPRERHFLQAHLVSCSSCKSSFIRCKGIYYEVQREVDLVVEDPQYLDQLQKILRQSEIFKSPNQMTFLESVVIFLQRQEVRWPLIGLMLGILFVWLKG